jgi:hypothetical protein
MKSISKLLIAASSLVLATGALAANYWPHTQITNSTKYTFDLDLTGHDIGAVQIPPGSTTLSSLQVGAVKTQCKLEYYEGYKSCTIYFFVNGTQVDTVNINPKTGVFKSFASRTPSYNGTTFHLSGGVVGQPLASVGVS